jgi:hypothetical protein
VEPEEEDGKPAGEMQRENLRVLLEVEYSLLAPFSHYAFRLYLRLDLGVRASAVSAS